MSLPWKTIAAYGLLAAVLLGCLYLGNLYAKLGVGRRTEALAVARRQRLLRD